MSRAYLKSLGWLICRLSTTRFFKGLLCVRVGFGRTGAGLLPGGGSPATGGFAGGDDIAGELTSSGRRSSLRPPALSVPKNPPEPRSVSLSRPGVDATRLTRPRKPGCMWGKEPLLAMLAGPSVDTRITAVLWIPRKAQSTIG